MAVRVICGFRPGVHGLGENDDLVAGLRAELGEIERVLDPVAADVGLVEGDRLDGQELVVDADVQAHRTQAVVIGGIDDDRELSVPRPPARPSPGR